MSGLIFEASDNNNTSSAYVTDVFLYSGGSSPTNITSKIEGQLLEGGLGAGICNGNGIGSPGGATLLEYNGKIYFSGGYSGPETGFNGGVTTLYVYNPSAPTVFDPNDSANNNPAYIWLENAWGSGVNPVNLVGFNGLIYFMGIFSDGNYYLWYSDGTPENTAPVPNSPTIRPYLGESNVAIAVYNINVYKNLIHFGAATGDGVNNDLWSYDPSTGNYNQISMTGLNPQFLSSGQSDGFLENPSDVLFMSGFDSEGHQQLFCYNGSSIVQYAGGGAQGLQPTYITHMAASYTIEGLTGSDAGFYFSGVVPDTAKRSLYFANVGSGVIFTGGGENAAYELATSTLGGTGNGLYPRDLTSLNGKLYFTGDDSYAGSEVSYPSRGLYVYNPFAPDPKYPQYPANYQLTELVYASEKGFNLNLTVSNLIYNTSDGQGPRTMVAYNNALYFSALDSNNNLGLYEYNPSETNPAPKQITGSSSNSFSAPFYLYSF
jgi:hypothetical protein